MLLKWTDRFTPKFVAFPFVLALAMGNTPSSTLGIEPPAEALKTFELDIEVWEMTLSEEDITSDFVKLNLSEHAGGYLMRRLLLGNLQIPPATETPRQRPPTRSSSKLSIDKETCVRLNRMLDEPTASVQINVKPSLFGSDEITLDYGIVRNTKLGEVKLTAKRDVKFGSILPLFIKPFAVDGEAIPEKTWLVLMSPRQQNLDGTTSINRVDVRQEMDPWGTRFLPRPGRFEIQISEGWSGLLWANSMGDSFIKLTGSTNVGSSKDARASDNYVRLEAFQVERPVMEVVYTDDGFIEIVARRPGVAALRYDVIGLDGKTAICELQIVVAADTTEFDRTVKDILPDASVKVTAVKDATLLTGFVAKKDDLSLLVDIAEQFYPAVIHRVKVGAESDPTENNSVVPIVENPVRQTSATKQRTTVGEPARVPTVIEFQPSRASRRSSAELRAFQCDVRALRDDVRRLSDLLEKRLASLQQLLPSNVTQKDVPAVPHVDPIQTGIQTALLKSISIDFEDAPLREVIRGIKNMINVNCVIDDGALAEQGLKATEHVSISVHEIAARSALKFLLEPLGLTFIEKDDVLVITNSVRSKGSLTTITYSVEDLIRYLPNAEFQAPGKPKWTDHQRAEALETFRQLISRTISPDSWGESGGQGSLQGFATTCCLVVRQTADVHQEVADLLKQIRRLKRLPQPESKDDDRTLIVATYSVADLIVPIPDEPSSRTKVITSDWLKLVDRIVTDVEPVDWSQNGGPCTIHAFENTFSLTIRATHRTHESIAQLLSGMRRDQQDVQVSVDCTFLTIPNNLFLENSGLNFDFDPKTGITRIDERQAKQLIAAVEAGNGESLFAPRMTMFNGGIANIGSKMKGEDDKQPRIDLHVRGNVSEDRRCVRLSVACNSEDLVNDLISTSYRLDDGGYLLLDVTDGLPAEKQSAIPNGGNALTQEKYGPLNPAPSVKTKVRTLILIQPRIILPVEEVQLAVPKYGKAISGNNLRMQPNRSGR